MVSHQLRAWPRTNSQYRIPATATTLSRANSQLKPWPIPNRAPLLNTVERRNSNRPQRKLVAYDQSLSRWGAPSSEKTHHFDNKSDATPPAARMPKHQYRLEGTPVMNCPFQLPFQSLGQQCRGVNCGAGPVQHGTVQHGTATARG